VSRGGRRRKGKRGRRSTGGERQPGSGSDPVEERQGGQPTGRRRGRGSKEVSVLEQMTSRPTQLTTLPPDGTVLEELIGAMQSEYGVPTTPQEYRLIIKVPAPEEPTDPNLEARPVAVRSEPEVDVEEEEAILRPPRSSRRRRRGRRRSGGMAVTEVEIEEEIVLMMDDADPGVSEEDPQS
jgi:hypothetical protein